MNVVSSISRKSGGRSLAPKDWDTEHEVAWNWLWENVERILKASVRAHNDEREVITYIENQKNTKP